MLHLAISGFVNMIVLFLPGQRNASVKQMVCVGIIVILWSFAGVSPNYTTIIKNLGFIGLTVNTVSPFTYSHELEFIYELQPYPAIFNTSSILTKFNFSYNDEGPCFAVLIMYWLLTNCLAYLILQSSRSKIYDKFHCIVATLLSDIIMNHSNRTYYKKDRILDIKSVTWVKAVVQHVFKTADGVTDIDDNGNDDRNEKDDGSVKTKDDIYRGNSNYKVFNMADNVLFQLNPLHAESNV